MRPEEDRLLARVRRWNLNDAPDPGLGTADRVWASSTPASSRPPGLGFKLHVSATVPAAAAVFDAVVPRLVEEAVTFKVTRDLAVLTDLNAGRHGLTQVGKFLTIYPCDNAQALGLAAWMDTATAALPGPRVISDRRYKPGSSVWYRYGRFEGDPADEPTGARARSPGHAVPKGVPDPFLEVGDEQPAPSTVSDFFRRFVILEVLARTARAAVFRAIDTRPPGQDGPRRCILRQAFRAGGMDADGVDAVDLLRWEESLLRELNPLGRTPAAFDRIEFGEDEVLVTEDIGRRSVRKIALEEPDLDESQALAIAAAILESLVPLHRAGLVICDLSPANVVLNADGEARIVDLEYSSYRGRRLARGGTRGFVPAEEPGRSPSAPSPGDDLFAVGRILLALLDGEWYRRLDETRGSEAVATSHCKVSPGARALIRKATGGDRGEHYGTATEMLREVNTLRASETPSTLTRRA